MGKLHVVFVLALQLFLVACQAQTPGCTDPLANNYDPSATVNDGSCTYDPYAVMPRETSPLNSVLSETSGLILWEDYVWTHNDNSDIVLYGLDTITGDIKEELHMQGVVNTEWEEVSQDEAYIYLGDFGNNGSGNRTDLHILRIEKASLSSGKQKIDTIWFSYSDQTDFSPKEANSTDFDCEAMIVSEDSIYLFTKQWLSVGTSIYSLAKQPGTYKANYVASHNVQGLITGATYLESEQLVVLSGYTSLLVPIFYLLYDFTGKDFLSGNKRRVSVSLPFYQIEGIATRDGLKYFVSNEYFRLVGVANNPQKLHIFDLSDLLEGYLLSKTSTEDQESERKAHLIYPNPADNQVHIKSSEWSDSPYVIYDQAARQVLSGKLTGRMTKVDISLLEAGVYIVKLADQFDQRLKLIIK